MSDTETNDVSPPTVTTSEVTSITNGRVKWFNNKAGYGFITVTSGPHVDVDVFVHHSAIQVNREQYKYLVQGEYVNFEMCAVTDNEHKWQAGNVKGSDGGKLMCETRNESREARSLHSSEISNRVHSERSAPRVRTRGPGPRDGDEWMLVRRRNQRNTVASPSKRETLRARNANRDTSN